MYVTFCIPCKDKVELAQEDDIVSDKETPRVHINPLRPEVNIDGDDDDKETLILESRTSPSLQYTLGS